MPTKKEKMYILKDLSGRGITSKVTLSHLLNVVSEIVHTEEELQELNSYLEDTQTGEEYISNDFKLIAL